MKRQVMNYDSGQRIKGSFVGSCGWIWLDFIYFIPT